MREMEILLGMKSHQRVRYGKVDPIKHLKKLAKTGGHTEEAWKRVQTVQGETSFQEALRTWLYRTPIHGSIPTDDGDEDVVLGFIDEYLEKFYGFMDRQCAKLQASMPRVR